MTEWAMAHPRLTFFLALAAILGAVQISYSIFFVLPNRLIRSRNLRKLGWPPNYCDADGDVINPKQKEVTDKPRVYGEGF